MALFIGLMSGTSLDGVDGVLVEFEESLATGPMKVLGHEHAPFDAPMRSQLLALNTAAANEIHLGALAGNAVARLYADVVHRLLLKSGRSAADVRALGAHGQTVRHRPGEFDGTGYTVQLLNGALLAELTGIDVVCDFRSRDVAAGGQGAPLVPAFHAECFSDPGREVAVLNLGGIANLTLLPGDGRVLGFDCGPANALMDAWCQTHLGLAFDDSGRWAASGRVVPELLQALLAEPFFSRPPPKSSGRDLFHGEWLAAKLAACPASSPQDVMATLAELTARSATDALRVHQAGCQCLLVCGGGAFNHHLMRRLAALMPGCEVLSTSTVGMPPDQVEALAFAWLAKSFTLRRPGNLPAVTGAMGVRPLGALYPGT